LWKALPADEKSPFETMYKTASDSYQEAMKDYKTNKAAEAAEAAAAPGAEASATPSPKKRKAAKVSTSASKKSAKAAKTSGVDLGEAVLKEARSAGYESQLKNLAVRPDVVESGKKDSDLLKALVASNGLVNPAKRALLGA